MTALPQLLFESSEFALTLSGDWRQEASNEPGIVVIVSPSLHARIAISCILTSLARDQLVDAIGGLARARLDALAQRGPVQLDYNDIELFEDGAIGHAAYSGQYANTVFWFEGWATAAKILGLAVSVEGRDVSAGRRVFNEVFAGFQLYLP